MKPLFSIIIIALIILVAFQVYALVGPNTDIPDTQRPSNSLEAESTRAQSESIHLGSVKLKKITKKVTQRNLFRVKVNGETNNAPEPEDLHLEKTSLKLTLWGTVTGQEKQKGWAIIEDLEKKQQDLYRVNDKIQRATIKSIFRNKVILTVNGKDQILEVSTEPAGLHGRKRKSLGRAVRPGPPRSREPVRKKPADIPETASQSNLLFKTRPHVKNGEASGVMIYSIKKNSVARRLGLRNGDVILAVDDAQVQDSQDFENFEDSIDQDSDITISILRRGKAKELTFSGQDNAYSIKNAEN